MSETEAANTPVARAAKAALAKQLTVAENDIRVLSVEAVEWSDGCLGLGGLAESCLQAITPGFRVLLGVNNRQYQVRTDQDAQQVRITPDAIPLASQTPVSATTAPQIDPGLIVPTATTPSTSREAPDDSPAVQAALSALATQLNVEAQSVTVISVEAVEWPDGCLGLAMPDQMCTQAIVPGYRVILEADGTQYEVRTDLNGQRAIVAPQ
jgi:hypothetical protein